MTKEVMVAQALHGSAAYSQISMVFSRLRWIVGCRNAFGSRLGKRSSDHGYILA
jgi:hypothetical protein